ncbi:MAG: DUF1330 domain-containing protein [Acidobacteria bacterium]|nr:DUF1330 domain-containing protein [Acidobacteriota bacterium]
MAGYALIEVEVTDDAVFAEFRERAPAVVEAHGGRFLVRGGATEVVQGDWTPHRLVVLEFDSVERAKSWWNSPEHTELRAILDRCSKTTTTIVEGV